ncbi:GntR family transcriptional regulator [Oceanobacillus massiliensis]|uniref:GntR family transcriptional regulator n=1 Tax=Oceanobacillus massiliensis TaxID=1465765 RepID=UPI00301A1E5B
MTAYQIIKDAIITGKYQQGKRLTEEELAEQLHVSRTPIREAIKQLESEGLIIPFRKRGVIVREFTETDIRQIYNLRALLESYATGEAAIQRNEEEIFQMEQGNHDYEQAIRLLNNPTLGDIESIQQKNQSFHSKVFAAAHNEHVMNHIERVVVVPLIFRAFYWYSEKQLIQSIEAHKTILQAIKDRESDRAKAAMNEHIYLGRDHVLKHIGEKKLTAKF